MIHTSSRLPTSLPFPHTNLTEWEGGGRFGRVQGVWKTGVSGGGSKENPGSPPGDRHDLPTCKESIKKSFIHIPQIQWHPVVLVFYCQKMGLFENTRRPEKNDPVERDLVFSLPRPRPPPTRVLKKNRPQPTQNDHPIKFAHDQCVVPGIDPMVSPHPRIQYRGLLQRIHTQDQQSTSRYHPQEHVSQSLLSSHGSNDREESPNGMWLTSSENPDPTTKGHLQQNEQEEAFPHQAQPWHVSSTMVQDYPVTGPSPGDNPPIYLSSLPLTWGKIPGDIFPRVIDFFSFVKSLSDRKQISHLCGYMWSQVCLTTCH